MSAKRQYTFAITLMDADRGSVNWECPHCHWKKAGRKIEGRSEQVKAFGYVPNCIGGIVRYFCRESAAYNYEAKLIAKYRPRYNANAGGGGAITRRKQVQLPLPDRQWYAEIERIGTRVAAARALLKFDLTGHVDPSKLEAIRQVAYGQGV